MPPRVPTALPAPRARRIKRGAAIKELLTIVPAYNEEASIGAVMLFFSAYPRAAHGLFSQAGIDYTPSAVAAAFPAMLAAIHLTLAVSRLKDEVRILAQQNALILLEVKELRAAARSRGAEEPDGVNARNRTYQKSGEAGG